MIFKGLKIVLVLLLVSALPVPAQTENSQDQDVNLEQIRQLREESEENPVLSEETRSRILELCDLAKGGLKSAADHHAGAAAFESERKGVDRQLSNLRADLARHESRPQHTLPTFSTIAEAKDALTRERARLKANRSALRNKERLAEDKASSRAGISQRLGELDLELEMLDDELRAQANSTARNELKLAARFSTLARREAALSEIEMLRVRLSLFADRSGLIPLEIDLAQRRVSFREELVRLIEDAAHDLRIEHTQESLSRIRQQGSALAETGPALAQLAAETVQLAEELWAPEGVITQIELTVRSLSETRRQKAQLQRIAELTIRKFEAYGDRGSINRWWPDIPKDFPRPGAITNRIHRLDEKIPEVAHRLITFEQQRSAARELARTTLRDLEAAFASDPNLEQKVRDLLSVRQDLLDQLIQQLGLYSNQLSEFRAATSSFLTQLEKVEFFLFSQVLWSRSVPKPIVPRFSDIGDGLNWLTSPKHWQVTSLIVDFRGKGLFAALLLIIIILLRQPMRRRLSDFAERKVDPDHDSLRYTIEATMITGLLAAPLPIAIWLASFIVGHMGDSTYLFASALALSKVSMIAAFFELTRQIFAPDGLAEAHFGWPTQATQPLFRGLVLTQLAGLPLFYISLHLAFAGIRLDSPHTLQIYNNSLGRIAFIAALLLTGLSILSMLRPEKKLKTSDNDVRVPWPQRFSEYAFPSVFLGAYPIITLATLVPAILAAFGFYVTGLLLAYQMLRTLLLALFAMVGGGLLHRWRIVSQEKSIVRASESTNEIEQLTDIEATDKQVRHLFRFAVIFMLAIGLYAIWSDAIPMLQMLKRVQILPRIELLEPLDDPGIILGNEELITEKPSSPQPKKESTLNAVPFPGADSINSSPDSQASKSLTLWHLLEAILAGMVTLILGANLPGVIEIVLKHRTTLDGGSRFALSALIRYAITIVGTVAVFGMLGIGWSNVQWLAAALTFGLGFGLQEIVANFVSGLILLIERPVRVGDVVTIGTLMGRVQRIQIRATTITLWDRSEMIVPNKEFITTKLVNWTLSDSKRRIDIPLRVAYGSDIEEVKNILIDIAEQHSSVLDDPTPQALVINFCDDAIKMELRFVVDFGQGIAAKDDVQMSINRIFRDKGIRFALPTSEVRLISGQGKNTSDAEET